MATFSADVVRRRRCSRREMTSARRADPRPYRPFRAPNRDFHGIMAKAPATAGSARAIALLGGRSIFAVSRELSICARWAALRRFLGAARRSRRSGQRSPKLLSARNDADAGGELASGRLGIGTLPRARTPRHHTSADERVGVDIGHVRRLSSAPGTENGGVIGSVRTA